MSAFPQFKRRPRWHPAAGAGARVGRVHLWLNSLCRSTRSTLGSNLCLVSCLAIAILKVFIICEQGTYIFISCSALKIMQAVLAVAFNFCQNTLLVPIEKILTACLRVIKWPSSKQRRCPRNRKEPIGQRLLPTVIHTWPRAFDHETQPEQFTVSPAGIFPHVVPIFLPSKPRRIPSKFTFLIGIDILSRSSLIAISLREWLHLLSLNIPPCWVS